VETTISTRKQYGALRETSFFSLLITNVAVMLFTIKSGGGLGTLMWIYFIQNLVIGGVNVFRILDCKHFSTQGFQINRQNVLPTRATQVKTALMFLMIYGFFHVGYAIFLMVFTQRELFGGPIDMHEIFIGGALFFSHHLYSFVKHRATESMMEQNIGSVAFFPFIRIVPMHLTIILGGIISIFFGVNTLLLVFFFVLKTLADLLMHVIEHQKQYT
jgi:hypothetical protein